MTQNKTRLVRFFFLCMLCLPLWLAGSVPFTLDDASAPQPLLRVAAPAPERQPTAISAYGPGLEQEIVTQFCRTLGYTPAWITVADREEGLALVRSGKADVLVGFGGTAPPPAAPDADAASDAAATPLANLVGGRTYAPFKPIRVKGVTTSQTDVEPIDRVADADRDEDDDILLLDPAAYALWLPYLGAVQARQSNTSIAHRWFWRDDASDLSALLKHFWSDPDRDDELAELTERYFGFLPRLPRRAEVLELADAVTTRLPKYQDMILKAAKESGVPPLFLAAVMYQESRFDPQAVSETNVRGIMQLTMATARMLGVDRKDPEQCIMGGARYLRDLWEQVGDKGSSEWDRWFMALAAYNQGMGALNQAIRTSRTMGDSGRTWVELKRAYPLSTVGRGNEARAFVEKVRYYHFMLQGLIALSPAEMQDLAPLRDLAAVPGDGVGPGIVPAPS